MKLIINKNKNVTDVNGKFSYFIKVVDDTGAEFAEYEQKIPATKYNQPDDLKSMMDFLFGGSNVKYTLPEFSKNIIF